MDTLPDGNPLLVNVGEKFQSVGLCNEGVAAFLKAGDTKKAIDCCVLLNQWDQAVHLAQQHNFPQIEGLLSKYASHLLEKEKFLEAIELYSKANHHTEAARLLSDLAQKASYHLSTVSLLTSHSDTLSLSFLPAARQSADMKVHPMRVKRLYVLAALEVDKFKKLTLESNPMDAAGELTMLSSSQAHYWTWLSSPDATLLSVFLMRSQGRCLALPPLPGQRCLKLPWLPLLLRSVCHYLPLSTSCLMSDDPLLPSPLSDSGRSHDDRGCFHGRL